MHIETCTKKLKLKAVEGRLVGYSNNSKSYRAYIPATRCIMESRNAIFIETPSRLLPPHSGEYLMKMGGHRQVGDDQGQSYITDNEFLRDLREYTLVLDLLLGASTDHITAGEFSANPQVAELLEEISEITRRDKLHQGTSELPQEESLPGERRWRASQKREFCRKEVRPGECCLCLGNHCRRKIRRRAVSNY